MRLKAPSFWYSENAPLAAMLGPASFLYKKLHSLNQKKAANAYQASIPVICVGNIVTGGAGKTPVTQALYSILKDRSPYILTRGYRGRIQRPVIVDPDKHDVTQVGDEALLHARKAPTVKSVNRAEGAKIAEEKQAGLIIMDDGLQNPSLHKDIKIVVIDGETGFGNRKLLPAGPLRTPLAEGLNDADAFVLLGDDKTGVIVQLPADKPVFKGHIKPEPHWIADKVSEYLAFAGLGRPEKFRKTLEDTGVNIVKWHPYPDHHEYNKNDILYLSTLAAKHKTRLITTEKDAVKLPPDFAKDHPLDTLPVTVEWEDEKALAGFLDEKLAG